MNTTEPEYILCANSFGMALYRESKEALMASDCYDFMVFRYPDRNIILEDLKEWKESISIDESTYRELHQNLCKKVRAFFSAP
jgi:NAD(P)H-flavin reductase